MSRIRASGGRSRAGPRRQAGTARVWAAALEQDDVVPDAREMAVSFPDADLAETALAVERQAGGVGGQDLRLQRPVSRRFRRGDQIRDQCGSDSLAARGLCNVDADLSDTGGASRIGNRRERGPAEHAPVARTGGEPSDVQVSRIPIPPERGRRPECGHTGRQSLRQDRAHLLPVPTAERSDLARERLSIGWRRTCNHATLPTAAAELHRCRAASRPRQEEAPSTARMEAFGGASSRSSSAAHPRPVSSDKRLVVRRAAHENRTRISLHLFKNATDPTHQ